ncbi:unnamed protein product [Schistocephalus solidus]|uniref:Amiloride-sensitive sodium channel n=1 Tax=Schistocephalus solidus TaxID=70667 RepID=A0A183SHA7_SCHSO|nr:unnamed protein product [Schistocephalus solidus]
MGDSNKVHADGLKNAASEAYPQLEEDRIIFEETRRRLNDWGERSTFHGVDVLMETPPDWRRAFVTLFLMGMSGTCWIVVGILVASFLNLPISTVIDNNVAEFEFPAVTICPDSPFTMQTLKKDAEVKSEYVKAVDFWVKNAGQNAHSPFDSNWRVRTKRTLLPSFTKKSTALSVDWLKLLVACQYNGEDCGLQGVKEERVPLHPDDGSPAYWTRSTAHLTGYRDEESENRGKRSSKKTRMAGNQTKSTRWNGTASAKAPKNTPSSAKRSPAVPATASSSTNKSIPLWSTQKPIVINHPSKYYCFQGWNDYSGELSGTAARKVSAMDGFQILLHEASKNSREGSVPAADMSSSATSRSSSRATVRYGEHLSLSLGQFVHQRLSTFYRPCEKKIKPLKYLDLKSFYTGGGSTNMFFTVSYTRGNCVATLRQEVMSRKCKCFSEDAFVPFYLARNLSEQGFCHSMTRGNATVNGTVEGPAERANCHDRISQMTAEEILMTSLPYSWKLPIFMRPTIQTQLLWLCPQFCTELVTDVERRQKTALVETLSSKLTNLSSALAPADIAVITISASETRTAIMSEGEQMTPFNLLASIGGIFGLFLGLSGVTTFEVIEAWAIILPHLIPLCRYSLYLVKTFWREFRDAEDPIT